MNTEKYRANSNAVRHLKLLVLITWRSACFVNGCVISIDLQAPLKNQFSFINSSENLFHCLVPRTC